MRILRHGLRSGALLLAPVAAWAADVSDPGLEERPPVEVTFGWADVPWLVGIAVLFGVICYLLYRRFAEGYGSQLEELSETEEKFEQEVLGQYSGPVAPRPLPVGDPAPAVPPGAPPAWPQPVVTPAGAVPASADGVEDLVRRLQQLAVLGDREGQVKMPIPPDAPIHRLRKGGIAVVLPRVESQAMLQHFVRRFDIVFALGDEGEVLVLERMQSRLNDLMDDPRRPG